MKPLFIAVLALLLIAMPLHAQETTDTPEDCREAGQAWYDAIDPDDALFTHVLGVMDMQSRATDHLRHLGEVAAIQAAVNALDFPQCIEKAHDWYLVALARITDSLDLWLNGDYTSYSTVMMVATQKIGQMRGYLESLGITVLPANEGQFLLK